MFTFTASHGYLNDPHVFLTFFLIGCLLSLNIIDCVDYWETALDYVHFGPMNTIQLIF